MADSGSSSGSAKAPGSSEKKTGGAPSDWVQQILDQVQNLL
ncbi:hypothetical protein [Nocardia transvalensis]|nr:hypothetical protein [Nocardia transvalensis]